MFRYCRPVSMFAVLVTAAILSQGCVGIYDNTQKFLNAPKEGLAEAELLQTYGFPDFTMTLEGGDRVFGYKVRDVKYIVLVGIYEGHDLLVTTSQGAVTGTKRIPRTKTWSLFQPVPWAVAN